MSQAGFPMGGAPIGGMPGTPGMPATQFWEDLFVYEQDFLALNAGVTSVASLQIQGDSDFKWMKACYFCDIAAAALTDSTRVIPLCTVQIQDGGSGRNLFSANMPVPSLFGTGQLPFILPIPRRFKSKTTLNFTVTNFASGTNYNLRLSLIGTKIFQGSPPQ